MLFGCQPKVSDLQHYVEQVKANTHVRIEPYPEFKVHPPFSYSGQSLRSPFVRGIAAENTLIEVESKHCLRPNQKRRKDPLESYGLDALSISGFFTSQGRKWALVKTNDGQLYQATVGNYLGLFYGRISKISEKTIMITEMLPDGAGCWKHKQTTLSMPSIKGEQDA
jgi:type IV pilus assembly protein PilP